MLSEQMRDPIVAVGFLTQRDLHVLGAGFNRLFPVDQEDMFSDLLQQLDRIEATPHADGVLIRETNPQR